MTSDPLADTVALPAAAQRRTASTPAQPQVKADIAALTDRGCKRPNNEDAFLAVEFGRHLVMLSSSLPTEGVAPLEQIGYGMVVADGLGGHSAGEVASRTAITRLLELVQQTPDWILSLEDEQCLKVMARMEQRLQQIADDLASLVDASPELHGMATTITLAVSFGDQLLIAHAGDSRAYLLRDGQLIRLTRDHTMAQHFVDLGIIDAASAPTHAMRNVLTNCLSGDRRVEVDFRRISLNDADRLLLCTDGLTDMIAEADLLALLSAEDDSAKACQALVNQALKNGGSDNVTVLLARYAIGTPDIA